MVAEEDGAGGVDDVVAMKSVGGLSVELEEDVGRNSVFIVFAVECDCAGDREAIDPTVGEDTGGRETKAAAGGVAHDPDVVVGLSGDGEGTGRAEAAAVGEDEDGLGVDIGSGLRGVGGLEGSKVVVAGTGFYLTVI